MTWRGIEGGRRRKSKGDRRGNERTAMTWRTSDEEEKEGKGEREKKRGKMEEREECWVR